MQIASRRAARAPRMTVEPHEVMDARPCGAFGGLKRRAEYLRVAKGLRFHATTMSLQAASRPSAVDAHALAGARFGLTVTKKVGGAVERNRIRRRLREALRRLSSLAARDDFDYVVLARREALTATFPDLVADLTRALRHIHEPRRKPKRLNDGEAQRVRASREFAVRPTDLDTLSTAARPTLETTERIHDTIRDTDQ